MPCKRASGQRGVSLVELLVVIGLLTLVAGLVAVRLGAGSERATLRRDAMEVVSVLRESRVRAALTGRVLTVELATVRARLDPGTALSGPPTLVVFPEGGAQPAAILLRHGGIGARLSVDGFTGTVTLHEGVP